MTWALENFPVWFGLAILAATYRRFPLSRLCLTLFTLHAFILMVGGYYTYASVPLGEWWKHWFGWERNHFDRLGHFAQGFVPALLIRELLLRTTPLRGSRWVPFLSVCVALAFSAFYEFIEWWSALLTGEAAKDFLGTQGDIWDTQWDMFLALIGALCAVAFMSALHDRSITRTMIWGEHILERPDNAVDPAGRG